MRCKKHYTDLSSTIGVCSCCLRERLLYLIAAQEQHAQTLETLKNRNSDSSHSNAPRNINHVHPRHHHTYSDQLFYTTPAVAPAPDTSTVNNGNKKRRFIRFISFHSFFRSRNRNAVDSVSVTDGGGNATSSSSKSSWFTSYIYGGKHRRENTACVDESIISAGYAASVRRKYCRDRGMSPARNSDGSETEDDLHNFSIGYESTTESWKNTPRRTPANNSGVRRGGHVRNVSGLTFCISPMVLRPSPNRKGGDGVGEIRVPVKPHLSNTKSFCANRSRKLADYGRPNQNR